VTPLAIAIVAEGDQVALGVGSFKVAAGNVVEHQVTILEMPNCQGALNAEWRSGAPGVDPSADNNGGPH
jgi:hypothetical protein